MSLITTKPRANSRRERIKTTTDGNHRRERQAIEFIDAKRRAEAQAMRKSFDDREFVSNREPLELLQRCLDEVSHEHDFWWDQVKHLTALQMTARRYAPILANVRATRKEIEEVTALMLKLGYEARRTLVEEAQVSLIAEFVEQAMKNAGLTPDQRRAVGREMKVIDVKAT